jgi:hypothetical protein
MTKPARIEREPKMGLWRFVKKAGILNLGI